MMSSASSQFVPKVHPLDRDIEADDPFELVAQQAQGDPELMLGAVIEEFLMVGCDASRLTAMFGNAEYPVLQELCAHFGAEEVARRIAETQRAASSFSVREWVAEEADESSCGGGETLVQLTLPGSIGSMAKDRKQTIG